METLAVLEYFNNMSQLQWLQSENLVSMAEIPVEHSTNQVMQQALSKLEASGEISVIKLTQAIKNRAFALAYSNNITASS